MVEVERGGQTRLINHCKTTAALLETWRNERSAIARTTAIE